MPLVGALVLHLVAGPVFDHVRNKKIYSPTTVRKLFHVVGITIIYTVQRLCISIDIL